MPTPPEPDAVLARSALAAARSAVLVTYPCGGPARRVRRSADVVDAGAAPVVELPDEAVREHLRRRPVATLTVAARGFPEVTLHGRADVRGAGSDERVGLDLLAVRVGRRGVPVAAYRAARPDPLAASSSAVLAHLDGHADDLRRCLLAQGVRAAWVTPYRVDRHGLLVQAVTTDGVGTHRLPFTRPVTCLAEVDPAYRPLLGQPPP